MKIYIIRHGETALNKEGRMQGRVDEPLNAFGEELAVETGRGMREIRFDGCFSSSLKRAVRTAELVLEESGNGDVPITIDDRIIELGMGAWEGCRSDREAGEIDPVQLEKFFTDTWNFEPSPGGESAREAADRTQEFLHELAARDDGKTYLVSTHGFALRAMLNFLYDEPEDFWHSKPPYNCVVNLVEAHGGTLKLVEDDRLYYDPEKATIAYPIS